MKELQEKIDNVFKLLSAIPVSGDSVEIMAAARELLRETYKLAGKVAASAVTIEQIKDTVREVPAECVTASAGSQGGTYDSN